MKETLPINKDVLKWARISSGLSLELVASRIDKDPAVIAEWEAGISTPSYPQLENLAYHVYKRPVAVFFFPEIPDEKTPGAEFRTLPETVIETLPPEIIRQYRKAKVFQINLAELHDGKKPVRDAILDRFSLSTVKEIAKVTSDIRKHFGIGLESQFSWESPDQAFKEWRTVFEKNGIFVFKDAFHNDDYSGFCIYDDTYPIIIVNNSMPVSRQIFTLFHELAHLLSHDGGVDFRNNIIPRSFKGDYSRVEIICNRFAGEFLVPDRSFDNHLMEPTEKNIAEQARHYSVSREVILRKYLDRKIIDDRLYTAMTVKWMDEISKHRDKSKGGHYYYTRKAYLGDSYINLAFSKYYQKKITIANLSEYLNIKVSRISTFEQYALA